jgi:quinol---cytochrome c reductase iron-sulfur subunit, bacillus type
MSNTVQTRRTFFVSVINALGAMIAGAVALPSAAYLLLKPKNSEGGDWVEVGDIAQLPIGKPSEFVYKRKRTDGWRKVTDKASAWIVRTEDNKVTAFSPACTHLGCAYHWEEPVKTFVCPCHTSLFGMDGKVVGGPAPRPLDRFVTKVEGGKILISPELEQS